MANNYKVKMVDLQNKYKFKIFCSSQMYDDSELMHKLDSIYQAFPKASATGTDATLNGTANAPMNIDLKGNGGKNLVPFTNQDFTLNNIRYYVQDGSLYLDGTSTGETSSTNQKFKDNFTFTLPAGTYYASNGSNGRSYYLFNKTTGTSMFSNPNYVTAGTTRSFTLNEETTLYIGFYIYQNTFNNVNNELMISTSGGDYEPYGASVTGDNTIDICGKNLLNIPNATKTGGGLTLSFENGIGTISGTYSSSSTMTFDTDFTIPAGTYTLSSNISGLNYPYVTLIDENNVNVANTTYSSTTNTFTITEAKRIRRVTFYFGGNREYQYVKPQLEKGSSATTYEPYQSQSYPINLGTTKLKTGDSIQGSKNNWNIVRADGTIEPIADTTLISQLNNLRYNAESYEGTTNISQVNSDLPFIFDASAIKDLSNL